MPGGIKDNDIIELIRAFLRSGGPTYALWALAIVVGLPALLKHLPQIIKSFGECYQAHRKTSAKIDADRKKLDRAMETRQTKAKQKGGKNAHR
jgi:hypothetical protein